MHVVAADIKVKRILEMDVLSKFDSHVYWHFLFMEKGWLL